MSTLTRQKISDIDMVTLLFLKGESQSPFDADAVLVQRIFNRHSLDGDIRNTMDTLFIFWHPAIEIFANKSPKSQNVKRNKRRSAPHRPRLHRPGSHD